MTVPKPTVIETPEPVAHVFKKAPGTHWRVKMDPAGLAIFECTVGTCTELVTERHLCKQHMQEWWDLLDATGIEAGGKEADDSWDAFLADKSKPWGPKPLWWQRESEAKRIMIAAVTPK